MEFSQLKFYEQNFHCPLECGTIVKVSRQKKRPRSPRRGPLAACDLPEARSAPLAPAELQQVLLQG